MNEQPKSISGSPGANWWVIYYGDDDVELEFGNPRRTFAANRRAVVDLCKRTLEFLESVKEETPKEKDTVMDSDAIVYAIDRYLGELDE